MIMRNVIMTTIGVALCSNVLASPPNHHNTSTSTNAATSTNTNANTNSVDVNSVNTTTSTSDASASGVSSSTSTSTSTGGVSSATNSGLNSNNSLNGGDVTTGSNASNATTGSNTSTTAVTNVNEAQQRNPVSSAHAPMLTSGNDTCMGSSSGGLQSVSVGLSMGSTWTDADCVLRKDALALHAMGEAQLAKSLLCGKMSMNDAVMRTKDTRLIELCGASDKTVNTQVVSNTDGPVNLSNFGE